MGWFKDLSITARILAAFILSNLLIGTVGYLGNASLIAGFILIGLAMGILVSRSISDQLKRITGLARQAADGNVEESIGFNAKGEIGELADAVLNIVEHQKSLAQAAAQIAQGDFSANITVRGEKDAIGKALQNCSENGRLLEREIGKMAEAAMDGKLSVRCNPQKIKGAHATLLQSVNKILDALIRPVGKSIRVMDKLSRRDLTVNLTGNYRGDHATFQNALNSTVKTLCEALNQVGEAADQVSTASDQISSGSQILSQRAARQAESIEELSGSLHEVSSMTRKNSENAKEARKLSKVAEATTEAGVESMRHLSQAIDRIKASSDSTAKIVKTIDEIAFQTNLLALNASVEAARAGDAGKGFAVVAEEVRNLAMRSAEAAKSTASLIVESIRNAESGVILNREVLANLSEINGQVKKVGAVMSEIAAASSQQAQGVDQVYNVINDMNLVTQHIAADAEESASGAEELSGQAEELRRMVHTFHINSNAHSANRNRLDFKNGMPPENQSLSEHFQTENCEKPCRATLHNADDASFTADELEQLIPFE